MPTDLEWLLDSVPSEGTYGDLTRATSPWWTSKPTTGLGLGQLINNYYFHKGQQWVEYTKTFWGDPHPSYEFKVKQYYSYDIETPQKLGVVINEPTTEPTDE